MPKTSVFGIQHSAFSIDKGQLEAVPLEAPIERRPAKAQSLRSLTHVAVEAGHSFLDQEALDVLEAHVFQTAAAVLRGAQAEIPRLHQRPGRHQDRAFDRMIE